MSKISVVINTGNSEKYLPRALSSVKGLADEVVVVDMKSTDKTVEIAKREGAKIYNFEPVGYVEPARNFAINKASGDWILVLDADEEISDSLAKKLEELASLKKSLDFYRLPRKNIIFGKWIRHSRWWPDYNIRFFKKGAVSWSERIHSVPETKGRGLDLPARESLAIVHHNYDSISQYLQRMDFYTNIQAESLMRDGYKFSWRDIIQKPTNEFLSRVFVGEAYKDGLHGLVLSLLQAVSEATLYIKVWEMEKFKEINLKENELENEITRAEAELDHWMVQKRFRRPGPVTRLIKKLLK